MLDWADDLRVSGTDLYMDSRRPRGRCVVSHAHSDHLPQGGGHARAFATPATAALAGYHTGMGSGEASVTPLDYRTALRLEDDAGNCGGPTTLRLLPAGHVVGSAMVHVTRPCGTMLYTGDFKLRESLTVDAAADPEPADVLVMESTFGLPLFRFPPWREVADELVELVESAFQIGRAHV